MSQLSVAILGGSGYVGGELARLILSHPNFELQFVTSESSAGKPLGAIHPNLRGATDLKFVPLAKVEPVDIVFSCLPHGTLAPQISEIEKLAGKLLVDCSADFRLQNAADYEKWYTTHPAPTELKKWVLGLPERHAEEIKSATRIAIPGCTATAAILAIAPLLDADLIDTSKIIFDIKTGSSGGGNKPNLSSHHSERAGVVRSYKLAGHRHTAEVIQEFALEKPPSYAVTSVPTVRGIVCHAHAFLTSEVDDKKMWQLFRAAYADAPFVRIVKEVQGPHALPEPKILAGTNFCDVGWVIDEAAGRITAVSALDNLGKGAAGAAVQSANLASGLPETAGLEFLGLHPI